MGPQRSVIGSGAVVMAYDAETRLIAVLEVEDGRLKPRKVFKNEPDE